MKITGDSRAVGTPTISSVGLIYILFDCLVAGPVEYDPEYQLIVQANNLTVEIDNEISE